MTFAKTIISLRENKNLSQQDIADYLKIARATYASMESGNREPNLREIRDLAELYSIQPIDLINGNAEITEENIKPHVFQSAETDNSDLVPRDIDPQVDPNRLREVLLYILEKVGAKPNVGETVLYKLLYFIDFDYYEKYGKSITGLTYIRNHFGPTPTKSFVEVVKGMEKAKELDIVSTRFFTNTQKKYLPTKRAELHELSANELAHIDDTLARLSDKTATELSQLSHKDTPWRVAKSGKPIDYRFVFYRTDLTAVTEPKDEL